mgnify:CR=1 FL=1
MKELHMTPAAEQALYSLRAMADEYEKKLLRACAATLQAEIERLGAALLWYRDKTRGLAINLAEHSFLAADDAITALSLDAGKRAADALGKLKENWKHRG